MRTEARVIYKLEFTPIPESIMESCLAPMPPLDDNGAMAYKDVPPYTAEVLGALELCNDQLYEIRELMKSD